MREKGYDPELAEINRYINNIGKRFGATTNQFRHEGAADGLPPPYHPFIETDNPDDYGIRLYCIRISPSIVILLNGDSKTHQKAALCENCKPHFERANVLANKITQAIQQGDIEIGEDERQLTTYDDFELTL